MNLDRTWLGELNGIKNINQPLLAVTMLLVLVCLPAQGLAQVEVPPFVAKGRISTHQANYSTSQEGSFSFFYSNGWWQIELRETGFQTKVTHCKRIADGIRHYTLFKGKDTNALPLAYACPTAFPPPGRTALFALWLSLCPHPQLPIIDDRRMHRFISVPTCEARLIYDPQNVGDYTARYLQPGNAFLSELNIANNGIRLDLSWPPPFELKVEPFAAPFQNGFTERRYAVLEKTNAHGWAFPVHAVHEWFGPRWDGKESQHLAMTEFVEIFVDTIDFAPAGQSQHLPAPARLMAHDERPPQVTPGQPISYLVTDDQWKPAAEVRPR